MQKYQLTILINEKVSEDGRKETIEAIKKHFGNLIKEDLWGVRSLAYEIKHTNKAYYAYFEFEAEPQAVIALDKSIRLNEDIIRYLIVKLEEKRLKTKPVKKSEEKEAKAEKMSEAPSDTVEAEVKTEESEKEEVKKTKAKKTKE